MPSRSNAKVVNIGGRQGRWTDEQLHVIESIHITRWHKFVFEENRNTNGRTSGCQKLFTRWKQDEVKTILEKPEFAELPNGVRILQIQASTS
jgi:hypothetical protein